MRISDWSSDVCSSDLFQVRLGLDVLRATCARKIELHRRPLPHLAVDADMAAGLLGKAINHAEAKARALALRLRREERLEHTIDDGRIDTGPGVAHRDHDVLPRHRIGVALAVLAVERHRSEEHTSELQSLMRHSYAVFCL